MNEKMNDVGLRLTRDDVYTVCKLLWTGNCGAVSRGKATFVLPFSMQGYRPARQNALPVKHGLPVTQLAPLSHWVSFA